MTETAGGKLCEDYRLKLQDDDGDDDDDDDGDDCDDDDNDDENNLPGVPDWATWRAFLKVGTMSRTCDTVAQCLHSGLNNAIWSMSCKAPRPCNRPISKSSQFHANRLKSYNVILHKTILNSCIDWCACINRILSNLKV